MEQLPGKSIDHKVRLPYLDGLRGLAALYVVFYHIWQLQGEQLPGFWVFVTKFSRYGGFSVVVFIVLSGYCLMLPVARTKKGYISGNLLDYFKRRGRRILPPYYAALFFSLLLCVAIFCLQQLTTFEWTYANGDIFSPNLSFMDVISHLLLIHNFTPERHIYSINGPMWSVAVEWQIYFLFPLLLLPVWRRWGWLPVITTAFLIGLTPHYLLDSFIELSHPWFVGLFALGMVAADIGFSVKPSLIWMKKCLPWGVLAAIFTGVAFLTEWQKLGLDMWISESFAGFATACLLVYCTNFLINGKVLPPVLRLVQSPLAITLGAFSYSLYLSHGPVLTVLSHLLHSLQMSANLTATALYLVGLPISLLIAYLFYLVFERPFTSSFLLKRKLQRAESR